MQLEELPVDLVEAICGYLAGFDAFQLSHTNSWWFALLSDGLVWHERMVHGPVPGSQQHLLHTWKRRYMQARSMLFHGLGTDDKDELLRASYACVEYPPPTDWGQFRRMYFALRTMHEESFSFDLARQQKLAAVSSAVRHGGLEEQPLLLSAGRQEAVAKDLKCDHWYHLVLTYDLEHQKQDVYLDGDNVWSTTGALHREWQHLLHEQFRFYSGVLPLEEVQHLAQGGDLSPKRLSGTLKYPGLRGPQSRINVELVACTRPAEGRPVEIVAVDRKASFPPQKRCRPPRALFA
ncbi:Concanavalin A-like lectin/glucanase domain [Phytophthora cactorum]|nr:Concanavalin A-like lectin/glucanase domain [Phytophthora cactorum]